VLVRSAKWQVCNQRQPMRQQTRQERQREQRDQHEQQPASSYQGAEHTPPQLTGDVETVVIGDFTVRCCASSRKSIFRPAAEGQQEVDRAGDV